MGKNAPRDKCNWVFYGHMALQNSGIKWFMTRIQVCRQIKVSENLLCCGQVLVQDDSASGQSGYFCFILGSVSQICHDFALSGHIMLKLVTKCLASWCLLGAINMIELGDESVTFKRIVLCIYKLVLSLNCCRQQTLLLYDLLVFASLVLCFSHISIFQASISVCLTLSLAFLPQSRLTLFSALQYWPCLGSSVSAPYLCLEKCRYCITGITYKVTSSIVQMHCCACVDYFVFMICMINRLVALSDKTGRWLLVLMLVSGRIIAAKVCFLHPSHLLVI